MKYFGFPAVKTNEILMPPHLTLCLIDANLDNTLWAILTVQEERSRRRSGGHSPTESEKSDAVN